MKILQNPIAVIALAVVALALITKQLVWPIVQRSQWMQHAPVAAASAAAPVPKPASQPEREKTVLSPGVAENAMPEIRIDSSAAGAIAARSAESPRRDPFAGRLLTTNQAKAYPSARDMLIFDGVWRQTGSALAVINGRVFAVGDSVLAFKVESIDHDRVWVVGPNGHEAVEFGARQAVPRSGPPSGEQAQPFYQRPRAPAEPTPLNGSPGEKSRQTGGTNDVKMTSGLEVKSVAVSGYDEQLVEAVKAQWGQLWEILTPSPPGKVVLEFRLHPDGRVTDLQLIRNDVTQYMETICEHAILDSSPYQPWPREMRLDIPADYRDIQFTFSYGPQ